MDTIGIDKDAEKVETNGLKPKQIIFAKEYAKDGNATKAATMAGYSAKNAGKQGMKLRQNIGVLAYIARLKRPENGNGAFTTAMLIEDLKGIAQRTKYKQPAIALKAFEMIGKNLGAFDAANSLLEEKPVFVGVKIVMGNGEVKVLGNGNKRLDTPKKPDNLVMDSATQKDEPIDIEASEVTETASTAAPVSPVKRREQRMSRY